MIRCTIVALLCEWRKDQKGQKWSLTAQQRQQQGSGGVVHAAAGGVS